ncbi:unnamed protein product [Rodentolepis nana]|uniref:Fmp27_GFWDK domain-containing protein n=1 Tax=Rodentolepis nana TaxID=102285 RepID=A0A158QGZ7_RODNA|nr:unnamed protein product [Rodentolepis nana]
MLLSNLILRKLPFSDSHRKVILQLTTLENNCLDIQMEALRFTFPFHYEFYKCFDEFSNVRRAIKYVKSMSSPYFAEVKAMNIQPGIIPIRPSNRLSSDVVIRIKKFTLEIKDDPFECKLSDDFMVLMDESVEQQKRVAALTAQLDRNRQARLVPISPAAAAAELQACLQQLEFQRALEYIARIRRFYSGYKMADDLFTWSMESFCMHVLSDETYSSPEKVITEIRRMDDVSPWNDPQPSDFSQLCCRHIHLTFGRFQWQLRDYTKNLIDATEVTITGPFAMATGRSDDPRCQRDCCVDLGPPWKPANVPVTRFVQPTKFYYELMANVKDLSLCYGSNWESTIAWLNLRVDDIKRASVDPSIPPLGWWDKVRLNLHGRLGFTCGKFSWLYSTSLDPYNAREFLTCQWNTCSFDWIPGRIFIHGDFNLFFETASKYDGVCHVLQIPGLNFEVSMDWLSFGDQFDHHSVVIVNREKLKPEDFPRDSYTAFRGNRLLLGMSFSVNEVTNSQPPRCFIYTNLIKLVDRLKSCMSRISRPIRRGAVFKRFLPRKPLFGQLIQSLELSFRVPCLEVTYWVSYTKRLGIHACSGPLDLRCVFGVHVEGEREARTSTNAVVFVLPPRNLRRRISPQWSLRLVDARLLNGKAWLLHQPDRTALHLISEAESSTSELEGSPHSFSPNSELLIFSSIRFKRELRNPSELPQQLVKVRIPGLENFNEDRENDCGNVEIDETKSSIHEESSSASPERRHATKFQLSHEDLEPVHHVTVENPKMRWNETNRNLVYSMMNMYKHAQTLKKNLSAQALKAISLDITTNSAIPQQNELTQNAGDEAPASSQEQIAGLSKSSTGVDAGTITEEDDGKTGENSQTSSVVNAGTFPEVPMLARLVKEAETAKFYAYCEEEPKQPDVMDQLQGLSLCTSTPVLSRQWHIELINCQVMLKPVEGSGGYVIVSSAKARLDSVNHPPVWRDAHLLSKSSLIGNMECMQYYATVGRLEATTLDQWLSTADVRDWMRLGTEFGQDALSGKPEVVGSGHAVGGVVSGASPSNSLSPNGTIQLQRMVSRCACQFVYVTYSPLDPNSLPPGQFVPPLPPTDNSSKILQSQEGADTFTLLHRTLDLCTNSLQYSMVFDIVSNLLLYVEPQQKERFERNRVGLSLLGERELRQAILRDQETLRSMVNAIRVQERELWTALRQFDQNLRAAGASGTTANSNATDPLIFHQPTASRAGLSAYIDSINSIRMAPAMAAQAEQILACEEKINQMKANSVEKNALLSQSIAHFQKVHVQSQRLENGAQNFGLANPPVDSASLGGNIRLKKEQIPNVPSEDGLSTRSLVLPSNFMVSQQLNGVPSSSAGTPSPSTISGTSGKGATIDSQSTDATTTANEIEADVVRRDEVCFEHALWRMTEADGQIGLADVELRGFLYARTHKRDDSGSHRFQLGSMRVRSLAPNSFYKEVLLPDCNSSYHHTGGPMIRLACTERPPVGGISVIEVMEVSVAPLILQVSKPFYNLLMPYFFPERGNEDAVASISAEHVENLEPASTDLAASSEDLTVEVAETKTKKRNRYTGKLISRFDPKSWSGRFRGSTNRGLQQQQFQPQQQQPRLKTVAEESHVEEITSESNMPVEPDPGGSLRSSPDPAVPLLPLDVMRERARRNHVFLYIKIPGFPIRLSYKGDKQKNLADVTNFELNIPMLEYHNRLWTWLDFVLEVKMRIRRQLIKEVIKQKLRPRRAISWHTGGHSSSDRATASGAAEIDDDTASSSIVDGGRFNVNNNNSSVSAAAIVNAVLPSSSLSTTSSSVTAAAAAAEVSRREQEVLELILGRHAAEHPPQPSGRKKFRVFR